MEAKNSKLEYFDIKNLPLVVDVVVPLWSPPIGDKEFKRFNVEYIVRMNMFDNDLNYQLVDADDGTLLSSAFLAKKGDASKADEWFAEASKKYPDNLKIASKMSHDYIELMDKRTFTLMNDDDIKLSLFVSRKPGCGSLIIDRILPMLHKEGFKNLYLYTDCDCNWQWYTKRGYTLVQEDIYKPFSDEHENYKTYIFKKEIQA